MLITMVSGITIVISIITFDLGAIGSEVKSDYAYHNGKWYYFDENGRMVTGLQTINGELRYFGADGSQLKGGQATNQETHQTYVFDATNGSGQLVTI